MTLLIIVLANLAAVSYSNRVRSPENQSTGLTLRVLWTSKPFQHLVQLSCNCPCYIARSKLRFVVWLIFLLVCCILRIIALALYASAGRETKGESLPGFCFVCLVGLAQMFSIDLNQHCVWCRYKPQCDKRGRKLSKEHKLHIDFHSMGEHCTIPLSDKPCHEKDPL